MLREHASRLMLTIRHKPGGKNITLLHTDAMLDAHVFNCNTHACRVGPIGLCEIHIYSKTPLQRPPL